jgi:hypothetical protein
MKALRIETASLIPGATAAAPPGSGRLSELTFSARPLETTAISPNAGVERQASAARARTQALASRFISTLPVGSLSVVLSDPLRITTKRPATPKQKSPFSAKRGQLHAARSRRISPVDATAGSIPQSWTLFQRIDSRASSCRRPGWLERTTQPRKTMMGKEPQPPDKAGSKSEPLPAKTEV